MAKLDNFPSENSLDSSSRRRKRSKVEIYSEVLIALNKDLTEHPRLSLTRVSSQVNMPYDRLKGVLVHLIELGFCENAGNFTITERGIEFLLEYRRFSDSLNRIGFEY